MTTSTGPDFTQLRATMVASQLRTVGVNDPEVVAAMATVPREKYVPAGREMLAYADAEVPLGGGRAMAQPLVTGLLLTHARITRGERVLVVGAGTGYSVALIARLTDHVVGVEEVVTLVAHAAANGIELRHGALVDGASEDPYDLIFFDGAVERIPDTLAVQCKPDGRVAAVVLNRSGLGRATIGRVVNGQLVGDAFIEVAAPLLPGFARAREFVF